jgi:ABC-type dipeptide/oligopeptide/nickel transport system ATPase component
MHEGRVLESGPVDDVIHDPREAYTRDLVESVLVSPAEEVAEGAR